MRSRVTTKQGDTGTSRTLSGEVHSKGDVLFECTGWVDSLRAHTALLRIQLLEQRPEGYQHHAGFLYWLLHTYFLIGTAVSDPLNTHPEYHKGALSKEHLERLEAEQRYLEGQLSLPSAFIVSASNPLAAQADITTTVARTLERHLVRLKETVPEFESGTILAFVNRLSDYLYVLARWLEDGHHETVDYSTLA